jgi:hypothetical protein
MKDQDMRRYGNHSSYAAYPDRLVEYLFAGMMGAWGLWLLNPAWDTFGNPQYAMLAAVASEQSWGVFSLCIAIVRMGALFVNGRYCRTPLFRFACSMLGVIWWMVLIWLFLLAPQPNPPAGFAFYPLFVIFEGVSCWRSMADAFHANAFRPISAPRLFRSGQHAA